VASSVYIANGRLVRPGAGDTLTPGGVLVEGDRITVVALTPDEQASARARAGDLVDAA